ncbi:hypothetical protein [Rudanella lutea]|uniref:hypothetical protein n=1 Tax=Rudanella lutea TaxID=451374 RepID=UPI00036D5A13|nr:hypothetical protein [Rudanella lutea]
MLKSRIPVPEAHVRQFIMARYGNNTNTVDINRKTMLGILCVLASEKVGFRHVLPRSAQDLHPEQYITLLLPDSLRNNFIHPSKVQAVAQFFGYLFTQAFLECCETSLALGITDYEAVQLFMERYGITEDMIASDTLRKKWRDHQRYMMYKTEQMIYPRQVA